MPILFYFHSILPYHVSVSCMNIIKNWGILIGAKVGNWVLLCYYVSPTEAEAQGG